MFFLLALIHALMKVEPMKRDSIKSINLTGIHLNESESRFEDKIKS